MKNILSGTDNPIQVYWKLLLLFKDGLAEESPSLEQSFANVKKDLTDIIEVLQEIEKWKKQIANNFEGQIRSFNQFSQSTHDLSEAENFMKDVVEEVNETKQKLCDFVPIFAVKWHIQELKKTININKTLSKYKSNKTWQDYNVMDDQLKRCFLCMTIFPENVIIKPRDIIYWWIGEGLVNPTQGKTSEQIGKEHFKELLEKRLINPGEGRNRRMIRFLNEPIYLDIERRQVQAASKTCTLDPNIRSLAISNAKDTNFFAFDSEGRPMAWSPGGPPRACLKANPPNQVLSVSPPNHSFELITLLNSYGQNVKFSNNIDYKLQNLTVLQLGRWPSCANNHRIRIINTDVFFKFLLGLKGLRFLGLQGVFGVKELPDNIYELSSLVILDLRACHDLERLPSSVGELKNLTHLDVSQCYRLEYFPSSIQNLEELQVLKGFVFGYPKHNDQADMPHLVRMKMLRKLTVDFSEKSAVSSSQLEAGKKMKSLRSLTITWRSGKYKLNGESSSTLDWIPSSLEKLDLRCFPLENIPCNLCPKNLPHLERLYFRGGNLRSLQGFACPQDVDWEVEVLRFRHLESLENVELEMLPSCFPCIRTVEIVDCHKFEGKPGLYTYGEDNEEGRSWIRQAEEIADIEQADKLYGDIKYEPVHLSIHDPDERGEYLMNAMSQVIQQKVAKAMVLACKCGVFLFTSGVMFGLLSLILGPIIILFFLLPYYDPLLGLALLVLFLLLLKFKWELLIMGSLILFGSSCAVCEFSKRATLALIQMKSRALLHGMGLFALSELVLVRLLIPRVVVFALMVIPLLARPRCLQVVEHGSSFYLGLALFALSCLSSYTGVIPLIILLLCLLSMGCVSIFGFDLKTGGIAGVKTLTELVIYYLKWGL